jgi:hypothetical protein
MPSNKDESIDYKKVAKEQLAEAKRRFHLLIAGLETTETVASDLIQVRQIRAVMDDCKRRLNA